MNSELIVKDVEFHGDMLRAAQDPDGTGMGWCSLDVSGYWFWRR